MSRADARINLILDEVVRTLKGIDGDPDLWLTAPKTVKRWSADPLNEPLPALFVRGREWGPNAPQTGLQHDGQGVVGVECVCRYGARVDDPERELHRLCADVISAIETNWELKDATGTQVVAGLHGIHVIEGYEPNVTITAAGYATTVVGFRVFWPWVAATP